MNSFRIESGVFRKTLLMISLLKLSKSLKDFVNFVDLYVIDFLYVSEIRCSLYRDTLYKNCGVIFGIFKVILACFRRLFDKHKRGTRIFALFRRNVTFCQLGRKWTLYAPRRTFTTGKYQFSDSKNAPHYKILLSPTNFYINLLPDTVTTITKI